MVSIKTNSLSLFISLLTLLFTAYTSSSYTGKNAATANQQDES
jgi:hypothetical protein